MHRLRDGVNPRSRSALVFTLVGIVAAIAGAGWLVREGHAAPRSQLQYLERTVGGAKAGAALPMLVVLHGLGDTPENFLPLFEQLSVPARLIAARAPDPWGSGGSWYTIDADASTKARQIAERARSVAELARTLSASRPTRGKPVVSGFSQGGVLSFALASYHAGAFTGAVPIAGSLPAGMPGPNKPPRWFSVLAFHGQEDRRIPASDGKRTFERLEKAGFKGAFTTFAGLGHGVNDAMRTQLMAALNELLDLASKAKSP